MGYRNQGNVVTREAGGHWLDVHSSLAMNDFVCSFFPYTLLSSFLPSTRLNLTENHNLLFRHVRISSINRYIKP